MNYLYWIVNQFSFGAGSTSVLEYRAWYDALVKPFFAPAPEIFGIAWGIIYPLLAIAFIWSLWLYAKKRVPGAFIGLFALNIALNLTFTPTLIVTKDNTLISLHIILVLGTLTWLIQSAWRRSKIVFVLLLPYLAWGAYATVLQLFLTALN